MKKILTTILMIFVLPLTSFANEEIEDFTITNGEAATIEVNYNTVLKTKITNEDILVGDIFEKFNFDGKKLEGFFGVMDIKYIDNNQIDNQVTDMETIIPANSEIYILFKSIDEGGLVGENTTFTFTLTGKVELESINELTGKENEYKILYNIVNQEKIEEVINEPIAEINEEIIEENNTGIKENIAMLLLASIILISLFMIPNRKTL